MNKRIKELMYAAGGHYDGENTLTGKTRIITDNVDFEKFAELIVKECLTTISNQSTLEENEDFREGFSHGRKLAWTEIRNKFGVK